MVVHMKLLAFQMSDQSASTTTTTIFVGNIQSIRDDQLREYFERYGPIEAFYHNGTEPADDWLIDYRLIRFSADTDINVLLTTKVDHTICRIRLDIHPYTAALRDETRLILDRKIGVAHTNTKLDRNVVKKVMRSTADVRPSVHDKTRFIRLGLHEIWTHIELYVCLVGQWP